MQILTASAINTTKKETQSGQNYYTSHIRRDPNGIKTLFNAVPFCGAVESSKYSIKKHFVIHSSALQQLALPWFRRLMRHTPMLTKVTISIFFFTALTC